MTNPTRPTRRTPWLTFDCYGTLIQWDEGVSAAAKKVFAAIGRDWAGSRIIEPFDRHEGEMEKALPFRRFHEVAASAFAAALAELGVDAAADHSAALPRAIPEFPPFPEVVTTLARLKSMGYGLAIISNTDDDLIAGNVAQLGGHVDRVFTAEQARAYKPSRTIFEHARSSLGIGFDDLVHVCASPALDHAAARDIGFRCIWIDRGTYRRPLADYAPSATLPDLAALPETLEQFGWTP